MGAARKQHAFVDQDGNRYIGIGTDKFLLIYFEGAIHDITPWRSTNAGVQVQFTPEQVQEYIKCSQDYIYFIENYS